MFSQGEARRSLSRLSVCQEIFMKREAFMKRVETLSLLGENVSGVRDGIMKMASGEQNKELDKGGQE